MLMKGKPGALLLNPWITDFAAYDFWFKPLSLLYIGAILRNSGFDVQLIDCLDRTDPSQVSAGLKSRRDGTGRFLKTLIDKPESLSFAPRLYGRYGITEASFAAQLDSTDRPDVILVTSSMTYWYPGVFNVIATAKEKWPNVPLILGGRYATICSGHAKNNSGADVVFTGPFDERAADLLHDITGCRISVPRQYNEFPIPAHDLNRDHGASTVSFSRGCPFKCTYCVSSMLAPRFEQRNPDDVVAELTNLNKIFKTKNIAFADDALLVNAEKVFVPVMQKLYADGIKINFYIPNAVHARSITPEIAYLMKKNNFTHIRLGFESADARFQSESGGKVDTDTFRRAALTLRNAGFKGADLGAYILCGHPAQHYADIENAVREAAGNGVEPVLTEYSPIPGTPDFERAVNTFRYTPDKDPLLQNSSIIMFQHPNITTEEFGELKNLGKRLRLEVRKRYN